MEEGSLRCDANVSVRRVGASELGTKVEVKNVNSFRFIQKALAYEIERQINILEHKGEIQQETRLWDSREQRTYGMRSKEFAHDYRYFPEPDLLPLVITEDWKEEVRRALQEEDREAESAAMELESMKERLVRQYGLSEYEAELLTKSKAMPEFLERVAGLSQQPKIAANWLLNEYPFLLEENGKEFDDSPVSAENFAELISLIAKGTVSGTMAKSILGEMITSGKRAGDIVAEKGLGQITDPEKIAAVARDIIAANRKQVEQYRNGKTATLGWFVGQVMKATRGQANPQLVQEILKKELG